MSKCVFRARVFPRERASGISLLSALVCFHLFHVLIFAETRLDLGDLRIDEIKIGEGRYIKFKPPTTTAPITLTPDDLHHLREFNTDDGAYTIYVPLDHNHLYPVEQYNFINYSFFVQSRADAGRQDFTEFVVPAVSEGDFSDRWAQGKVTIAHSGLHQGAVDLPVHSTSRSKDFLSVAVQPAMIDLANGDYQLGIAISNLLEGMKISIDNATIDSEHHQYWTGQLNVPGAQKLRFAGTGTTDPAVFIDTNDTASAILSTSLLQALGASIMSVDPDKAPETLDLTIRYSPELGGLPRTKTAKIKVRFNAPLWSLFLASIFGSLVGSSITLCYPSIWPRPNVWRPLVSGALLAIVCEMFALATNTKVATLGFNLDPSQILPAIALGVLVGLSGLKTLDTLKVPIPGRIDGNA